MKIGVDFCVWDAPFRTLEHLPLFERVAEFGGEVVEIVAEDDAEIDVPAIRAALADNDLSLALIGIIDPSVELSSPDAATRQAGVEKLQHYVDLCAALGADVLSVTFGFGGKVLLEGEALRTRLQYAAECFRAVGDAAQNAGVRLAHEVLNRYETNLINTARQAQALMKMVDHPAVGIHLDCFHMGLEEDDQGAAIRTAGEKLFHLHANSSHRGVPGCGQINWPVVASALQDIDYSGYAVFESFNRYSWLGPAGHFWRPFADSPDALAQAGLAFLKSALQ